MSRRNVAQFGQFMFGVADEWWMAGAALTTQKRWKCGTAAKSLFAGHPFDDLM